MAGLGLKISNKIAQAVTDRISAGSSSPVSDLHAFYRGRGSFRYCDICVFASEDHDIATSLREMELDLAATRAQATQTESSLRL